jgi:hypothetical protein
MSSFEFTIQRGMVPEFGETIPPRVFTVMSGAAPAIAFLYRIIRIRREASPILRWLVGASRRTLTPHDADHRIQQPIG